MNIRIIILSLMLLIAATPAAYSQKGLGIEPFFEENTPHNPDASVNVVSITGNKLKEHDLSIYRSVSVTGDDALAQRIERAVTRDGTKAESREVSLKKGHLYFGFYSLPPVDNDNRHMGENRYIFYLNSTLDGGRKITLIYLQGKAEPWQIRRMIKK